MLRDVANVIQMTGLHQLPIFSTNQNGRKYLDFNKIIPTPEELKSANRVTVRDWCYRQWGTESNSFDCCFSDDGDTVQFLTVENRPNPIIQQLVKMNPNVTIKYWWADNSENFGNFGYRIYKDGSLTGGYDEGNYSEACHNINPDEHYDFCWRPLDEIEDF